MQNNSLFSNIDKIDKLRSFDEIEAYIYFLAVFQKFLESIFITLFLDFIIILRIVLRY